MELIERLLTAAECMAAMGIGSSEFYERIAAGRITTGVKIGIRQRRWPASEVKRLVELTIAEADESRVKDEVAKMIAARAMLLEAA